MTSDSDRPSSDGRNIFDREGDGAAVNKEALTVCGRDCIVYCGAQPKVILIQPTGAHEQNALDAQLALLERRCGDGFLFAAFPVTDWNRELSPWDAPPAFGKEAFGHGAAETLVFVEGELLPMLLQKYDLPEELPVILGGYSLAGLFSLWSALQTDRFAAAAAASPSVWFPGWVDFARQGTILAKHVYLSLGDREEKTKNASWRRWAPAFGRWKSFSAKRAWTVCWNGTRATISGMRKNALQPHLRGAWND